MQPTLRDHLRLDADIRQQGSNRLLCDPIQTSKSRDRQELKSGERGRVASPRSPGGPGFPLGKLGCGDMKRGSSRSSFRDLL